MNEDDIRMLSVAQVAERLNLSRQCVYQLIETGQLTVHRFGVGRGTIRVSESDLAAYVESCRQESTKDTTPRQSRPMLKHLKL